MGKRMSFALAAATLLFVGAGCAAGQQVSTDVNAVPVNNAQPDTVQAGANVNAGIDAGVNAADKVVIPATIDASVDAILKDGSAEIDAHKDVENDASEVDSDKASAKAFGTASYDNEIK